MKNTLAAIAAREAGFEAFAEELHGPTAIAFVEGEAVDAAKALRDFAKDNKQLVIKGGSWMAVAVRRRCRQACISRIPRGSARQDRWCR